MPASILRRQRGPLVVAAAVVVLLLALADRFGWHRDELYFVLCGRHLAWGYVDQPPLVPAIARLADVVAPGNLVVLRLPAALIGGGIVLLVAGLCRELGGDRTAQLLAALVTAASSLCLAVGHLLSTEDLDVVAGLALTLLVARSVRTRDSRWLGLAAAIAGAAVLNKYLVVLPVVGLLCGLAAQRELRLLLSRWVLGGAVVGALVAAPNLVWQAAHSWPELTMASSLSQGNGTYGSRPQVVVLQLGLTAPVFVPLLVAGFLAPWRWPALRPYRFVSISWAVVFVVILLLGGKAYYDAPELLALLAPGSVVTAAWLTRGRTRLRTGVLAAGTGLAFVVSSMLFLPVWPTDHVPGFVEAVNQDVDGMVGWPAFVRQVAAAYDAIPASGGSPPALLTEDYSDAGALARYGPQHGLPQAYSGHNSMADFGRPPDGTQTVLAVGWDDGPGQLEEWFGSVTADGAIRQGIATGTDTDGERMWLCSRPRLPWPQLWSQMRHVD
jgi:4-amino-4-deoxy-L-arabinose transferase-like glycosyltransferase